MKNEYKRILYAYVVITAFLSFVFFTCAGVTTAKYRTQYVESKEQGQIIVFSG